MRGACLRRSTTWSARPQTIRRSTAPCRVSWLAGCATGPIPGAAWLRP